MAQARDRLLGVDMNRCEPLGGIHAKVSMIGPPNAASQRDPLLTVRLATEAGGRDPSTATGREWRLADLAADGARRKRTTEVTSSGIAAAQSR